MVRFVVCLHEVWGLIFHGDFSKIVAVHLEDLI